MLYICLDESGSWGKSKERYFVIGGYVTKDFMPVNTHMRRATHQVKKKFNMTNIPELKASMCCPIAKDYILRKISARNIDLFYIVVDKYHVPIDRQLGKDQHRFCNYITGLLVMYIVIHYKKNTDFRVLLDNKSIRVGSLNSFEDYIKIKLCYDLYLNTNISVAYKESAHHFYIQAADFICNAYWTKENYDICAFSDLLPRQIRRMTFPPGKFGI